MLFLSLTLLFEDGSPFLLEKKKKLNKKRVSNALSSHLEHRPSREEFDLRFKYYFTDTESLSSMDNASYADTTSTIGDNASNAGDSHMGMLRAHSAPNCSIVSRDEDDGSGDEEEISMLEGGDDLEEDGGGDGAFEDEFLSRSLPDKSNFEDYYDYSEDNVVGKHACHSRA